MVPLIRISINLLLIGGFVIEEGSAPDAKIKNETKVNSVFAYR